MQKAKKIKVLKVIRRKLAGWKSSLLLVAKPIKIEKRQELRTYS